MARFFKNPTSDQVEEVDGFQVLAIIFFPLIYLVFAELWWHVLVWVSVIFVAYLVGGIGISVAFLGLYGGYCFTIRTIVSNAYLRKGWSEVADMKGTPLGASDAAASSKTNANPEQDAAR